MAGAGQVQKDGGGEASERTVKMCIHYDRQTTAVERHGPVDLLICELRGQQPSQNPSIQIASPDSDVNGRRQNGVQYSREPQIPCDIRIAEPQTAIDGGNRSQDHDRPSPGTDIPREQCPQEKEAHEIESGMAESEVNEVRRQQAPPLAGCDRRAVITQQVDGVIAEKQQCEDEAADCEERRAVPPVVVESFQADP